MTDLTKRQKQIYDYILAGSLEGMTPTVREIALAFDIASPNGVACHLRALKNKGFVTAPEEHQSRAWVPNLTRLERAKAMTDQLSKTELRDLLKYLQG